MYRQVLTIIVNCPAEYLISWTGTRIGNEHYSTPAGQVLSIASRFPPTQVHVGVENGLT